MFDAGWYRAQLRDVDEAADDPLGHYLTRGSRLGLSPNPLFAPSWYRSAYKGSGAAGGDPLAHYVLSGMKAGASPHPFFDAAWYAAWHPESKRHPYGPLGHYLEHSPVTHEPFHPDIDVGAYHRAHPDAPEPLFEHCARAVAELLIQTRGHADVPRMVPTFDHAAAEEFKAGVLTQWRSAGAPSPLVSVILPTKDRARETLAAASSVLDQSYPNIELKIVDDGSSDGTEAVLAPVLEDPRVEFIRRDTPGGVSVARNAGLARAHGTYVAYLDSDNTWKPDFLGVMIAFLVTKNLRVGYAVSELIGAGQRQYRCIPFDADALRERNYIDCIVLVHERSLLDEVGTFDESLRRMVDWDLMIRMATVTDFTLAPFVATTYDLWEERSDRLSLCEPFGFRYVIKSKRLVDWPAAEATLAARDPDLVSVVIHACGDPAITERCLRRLLECTSAKVEVVLVDTGSNPHRALALQLLGLKFIDMPVRVVRVPDPLTFEVASNIGVVASRGGSVALLTCDTLVERGWLQPLICALRSGGVAAAGPVVLSPSGVVFSAGIAFDGDSDPYHLSADIPWHSPELEGTRDVPALAGLCLLTAAETYVQARGADPFYVDAVYGADLSLRLQAASGGVLRVAPDSAVIHLRQPRRHDTPVPATEGDNRRYFRSTWSGRTTHLAPPFSASRPRNGMRWAIKTAVPDIVERAGWGDYYFAVAIRDALRRCGHEAVVDCQAAWHRPSAGADDVVLVLRGKAEYRVDPEQVNLLWLISHPDLLSAEEASPYDQVLVASEPYAGKLAAALGYPVEAMLQCTDQNLFAPNPDERHADDDIVFVGNSRGVMRPVVADALAAGIDLVLYGNGWDGLVPAPILRGRYIPNDELARTYTNAGVVLNDHWEDMRRHGFISNRLFDLSACGARVVSDAVAGMEEMFGDVVSSYDSPESLARAVATQLADSPERAAARAELSARVRRDHTFDARVARLVELATELRARRRQS